MTLLVRTSLVRRTALVLVVVLGLFGFLPRVDAGFLPSADSWSAVDRQSDMAKVQMLLEDKTVRERLKALGLTEEEISARLDQLSDQEIHALATQLNHVGIFLIVFTRLCDSARPLQYPSASNMTCIVPCGDRREA